MGRALGPETPRVPATQQAVSLTHPDAQAMHCMQRALRLHLNGSWVVLPQPCINLTMFLLKEY